MRSLKPHLRGFAGYLILAIVVLIGANAVFNTPALAQVDVGLEQAEQIGLTGTDPRLIVARIIQVALGVLGITAVGLLIYAGFLWMTSGGEDEKVGRAKTLLRNALIGLILILSAFAIVTYVFSILRPDLYSTPPIGSRGGIGGIGGGGGFPIGVISSHYPDRGQTNVARNTNIMVTFTEPILVESIIDNAGTPDNPADDRLNTENIFIRRSADDPNDGPFVPAAAAASEDGRSFVFDPIDLLGSSEENTLYTVVLGEGITTAQGRGAFGNFGAYAWEFEVGTFIDLEPPQVESVIPAQSSTHPRNVVVQINFNEAMNPLTASGEVGAGFDAISIRQADGSVVEGRYMISNQYRTVEFITNDLCGKNSCGEDVFCLPGDAALTALLRAATISLSPPTAAFPYDGLTDAAANSLDGNLDGSAQGPQTDNYTWSFQTTNQIDLTAPVIVSVSPNPFSTQVDLNAPVTATFSKPLQFSTINRKSVSVDGLEDYRLNASSQGGQSRIDILHRGLLEETTYTPVVTSDVRDLYQNCYRPCVGP